MTILNPMYASKRTVTTPMDDDQFIDQLSEHKSTLYRFLNHTLLHPSIVDDVFSAGLLRAYEKRHEYVPGTSFRDWILRILVDECHQANQLARRTHRMLDSLEEPPSATASNEAWETFYDLEELLENCDEEVYAAFQHLAFAERVSLLLRLVEQLSHREIADVMEIPAASVARHLATGRKKIRAKLASYARRHRIVHATHTRPNAVRPRSTAHV